MTDEFRIKLTHHGRERYEERIGTNLGEDPEVTAGKAFRLGLKRSDLSGTVYRWAHRRVRNYPNKILRVYKGYLFLYTKDKPIGLVTVFPVPTTLKNKIKRSHRKRKRLIGW